jgi:DNA-binding MarR family transcriptional regulator
LINHIDVSSMLRKSVCELYSNLVTRPTGAAVRSEIEQELDRIGDRALTVIDFSHVGLLDFSCADEIVAKLLLQYISTDAPRREVYFLFRGISEAHMEAIETVLERHKLALVTQHADGETRVLGILGLEERRAWEIISQLGAAAVADVAERTGLSRDDTERTLDRLWRRRLLIRADDGYVAVGSATIGVTSRSLEA